MRSLAELKNKEREGRPKGHRFIRPDSTMEKEGQELACFEICDPRAELEGIGWQLFGQSDSVGLIIKKHF